MSTTASPSRARTLAKLAATVCVAGALVAAMLLPWVGGAGLAARDSASLIDALPAELTDEVPANNTVLLDADGRVITSFYDHNRTNVRSDQIADVMKRALVDIEDSRFYSHNGLDVQGTLRALVTNVRERKVAEGGSTITQQLVKQTLLQSAGDDAEAARAATEQEGSAGLNRKLKELRLALAVEEEYSKEDILTRYLNIVYFGKGAYGIQSAAQLYFSVDAIDLTLPQAAMLAGLVQSPRYDNPIDHPEAAQVRRDQVLGRMLDLGDIDRDTYDSIAGTPVEVNRGQAPGNGCIAASLGGFFCDYAEAYLTRPVDQGGLGLTPAQLRNDGLTIQTTMRPDMQVAGDQAVLNTSPLGDKFVAAYDVVEPGTGHVLALSVNRRFGCEQKPECESVNLNVVPSRGSGSTFKVFTAAAALERMFGQYYTITTANPYVSTVYGGGCAARPTTRFYCIANVGNNYPNTLDMERALYSSSNTYFLALQDALGSIEGPVRMAERMGMHFDDPNTQYSADTIIRENRGSFSYGTDGVSPLDLASAYSTLAASGTRCDPTPIVQVLDRNGQPLLRDDGTPVVTNDNCTPEAIPPGVATTLNQMLRKDVEPGFPQQTAPRAYIEGHEIAGKTGTINGRASVSFVGYTPEYAGSVMVWNSVDDNDVGTYGGGKAAEIWHDAMLPILSNQPTAPFPPADPYYQNGNTRVVPACTGTVAECQAALTAVGLQFQVSGSGTAVTGTNPPAGTRTPVDTRVTILTGRAPRSGTPAPGSAQPTNPADSPAPTTEAPAPPAEPGGQPGG